MWIVWGKQVGVDGEGREMCVKASEGIWKGVRAKERREAKKAWKGGKEVYRERNKIEQVIGSLKNSCGDVCRERKEEMAKKAIMMMAILWNMAVLMVLGFAGYSFFVFGIVA